MEKSFRAGDVMFGVFYPRGYIVAVFDERSAAEGAQAELAEHPRIQDPARLWTGDEALAYHRQLREDHTSLIERFAGLLAHDEAEILHTYMSFARAGSVFLTIHVEGDEAIRMAQQILASHGGHSMHYYGDWTVRSLSSDRSASPAASA